MYRKITITDETNDEIVFNMYPDDNNRLEYQTHDIAITLDCQDALQHLLIYINKFMSGNNINKVEVEEIV